MAIVYEQTQEQAEDENRVFNKVFVRLMPILLACFLVAYLDRVNVGFAKLQMQDALRFNDAVFGLGAGMFFAGYFLFELPSNLILSKVGGRRWIARIMLTWGVISAATLLVRSPTEFYLARFLLGLAEAGFTPAIIYLLTLWFPARFRGRAMAVFTMGAPLAFVIGGPISGLIMRDFQALPALQAWQWLFLIEALPAILMAFVVLRYLADDVGTATWLDESERRYIAAQIKQENANKTDYRSVAAFLRNGQLWAFCLIFFCMIMGLYALGFWMPSLIKQSGVTDPAKIGFYTAVPNICAMIGLYLSTRSADRSSRRRAHYATFMAIGAVGLCASMAMHGGPVMTTAMLCVAAIGVYSSLALFWALPTATFVGVSAAAACAFINSVGNLAGFFSPSMIGYFNVWFQRTDLGMYAVGAFLLLGAALAMLLPARLDR